MIGLLIAYGLIASVSAKTHNVTVLMAGKKKHEKQTELNTN